MRSISSPVLVLQLLPFERGQPPQLHVEDRPRLHLRELERLGLQQTQRCRRRLRPPDRRDYLVEQVDGAQQTREDVLALLRLLQLVLAAAPQHFATVVEEQVERPLQPHPPGRPIDDRHHVDRERRAHGRVLVEQVLDLLGRALALQFDHHAHPVAVALVAQVGDALDLLVAHEVRDLLESAWTCSPGRAAP